MSLSAIGVTNDQTFDNILVKFGATINNLTVSTFNNPLLAEKGSLLTSNGTANVALPLGANGSHLEVATATVTGLSWILSDGFSAQFSSGGTQSIPSGASTTVTGGTGGWIVSAAGSFNRGNLNLATGVFTCVTAGTYLFVAGLSYDVSATGVRIAEIQYNSTTRGRSQILATGAGTGAEPTVSALVVLAVGDTVKVNAEQSSGGPLNIVQSGTYFAGYRLA